MYDKLDNLSDRVSRLEERRISDSADINRLADSIDTLVSRVSELHLKMNTYESERRTVIGIAGFVGSAITLIAEWVYRFMTKGG